MINKPLARVYIFFAMVSKMKKKKKFVFLLKK